HRLPWNPAAAGNCYRTPILAWLADNWRCIWVQPGRRDLHALHRMIQVLPRGVMTLFPEGTRTRDGSVGPGHAGTGLLILATRARVIPVTIEGVREGLPSGRPGARSFEWVCVTQCPPLGYAEAAALPGPRATTPARS